MLGKVGAPKWSRMGVGAYSAEGKLRTEVKDGESRAVSRE